MLFQPKTSIGGVWRTTYILCILFDVRKSIVGSWILHIFLFSPLDGRGDAERRAGAGAPQDQRPHPHRPHPLHRQICRLRDERKSG